MNKRTPGPWHTQQGDEGETLIKPVPGQVVAVIEPQANSETEKANARLIAAAPEMLEALKELTAWDLESLPGEVSLGFSGIEKDIALAKAAIAKATGS